MRCSSVPGSASLLVILRCLHTCGAWDFAENGGDWTDLGLCAGTGGSSAQSPINLPPSAASSGGESLLFKYPPMGETLPVYNNGYSIASTIPESYKGGFGLGASVDVMEHDGAAAFRLWQINFHSPSEHTLAGTRMPLELQMVHQRVTGSDELAIISILFTEKQGAFDKFLSVVREAGLPQKPWDEVSINKAGTAPVDAGSAVPDPTSGGLDFSKLVNGSAYFHYTGSLTVPPCETNVKYYVRQNAVSAGAEQIAAFRSVLEATCPPNGNYREILSTSTAGQDVTLIASKDPYNPKKTYMPVQPPASAGGAPELPQAMKDSIRNSKDSYELKATDSDEMRSLKEHFNQAKLSLSSARIAVSRSKRDLLETQGLYEGSPGIVDKIRLKWEVIGKQNIFNDMTVRLKGAEEEEDVAVSALARATKAAEPAVSSEVAMAAEGPPEQLDYNPRLNLPRGYSASPFSNVGSADTSVRIGVGEGMTATMPTKLAPNLKQGDGLPGEISIPGVMTTTTAAPTVPVFAQTSVSDGQIPGVMATSLAETPPVLAQKGSRFRSRSRLRHLAPEQLSVTSPLI